MAAPDMASELEAALEARGAAALTVQVCDATTRRLLLHAALDRNLQLLSAQLLATGSFHSAEDASPATQLLKLFRQYLVTIRVQGCANSDDTAVQHAAQACALSPMQRADLQAMLSSVQRTHSAYSSSALQADAVIMLKLQQLLGLQHNSRSKREAAALAVRYALPLLALCESVGAAAGAAACVAVIRENTDTIAAALEARRDGIQWRILLQRLLALAAERSDSSADAAMRSAATTAAAAVAAVHAHGNSGRNDHYSSPHKLQFAAAARAHNSSSSSTIDLYASTNRSCLSMSRPASASTYTASISTGHQADTDTCSSPQARSAQQLRTPEKRPLHTVSPLLRRAVAQQQQFDSPRSVSPSKQRRPYSAATAATRSPVRAQQHSTDSSHVVDSSSDAASGAAVCGYRGCGAVGGSSDSRAAERGESLSPMR
jgi:hypothetical protein